MRLRRRSSENEPPRQQTGPLATVPPPERGHSVLLRFFLGVSALVLLTAGATATAGLLTLDTLAKKIRHAPGGVLPDPGVTRAEAGKPQTLLLIGSDKRYANRHDKHAALSDTLMLIRLDPDQEATTLLSIPRDLHTQIPGYGIDKINSAYSLGGPALTVKTLKQLLGIKINHVINVNFRGFRRAVDEVGCVYADIDRRYYHSNLGLPQSEMYAEIDIDPGYQRLCGQKALDYVRFRHADNDFVRAARQQDFLRAAKDQISTSSLIGKHSELVDIFANSTQADKDLGTVTGLESLLKLALFSAGHPVREISFPGQPAGDSGNEYVVADPAAVQATVRKFLHGAKAAKKKKHHKQKKLKRSRYSLLVDSRRAGEDEVAAIVARHRVPFPVYFPTRATQAAHYTEVRPNPRAYTLLDRAGHRHHAYRLVLVHNEVQGQYYGIQGTDWRSPPLLSHPTSTREAHGRRLLLYRVGNRLRLVAWRTTHAAYWVANTLDMTLTNTQMIDIAASLDRIGSHRR